jgi:shikimate kinase
MASFDRRVPQTRPVESAVKAVFLVGFMGAGKSTVGQALSRRLGWVFEDLDQRIERNQGRTVAEIFRDSGEEKFRQAELNALGHVLKELRAGVPRIVALGGGAFVQKRNFALLSFAGVSTVFLDAPVHELWRRCSLQATEPKAQRPLIENLEKFRALHESRRRSYLKAMLRIETAGRSVEGIAEQIAAALKLEGE